MFKLELLFAILLFVIFAAYLVLVYTIHIAGT